MDDPMSFIFEVKHLLNEGGAYEEFLQTITNFKAQKISIHRLIQNLTKLFHGHKTLITKFNEFLPDEHKIVPYDDGALSFLKRVQTTFQNNHEAYLEFLRILDAYRHENKSIIEVYKEVAKLFRGHDDLFFEFKSFLPDTSVRSSISQPYEVTRVKKKRRIVEDKRVCGKGIGFIDKVKDTASDPDISHIDKVKDTVSDPDISHGLTKCVELYRNKIINRVELRQLVDHLIDEYPELLKGFHEFMENSEISKESEVVGSSKSFEENIEVLDLSKCVKITPSYRLLPMNCRYGAIIHEDLNDACVWVAPEIKEFKNRHHNRYEKKLFMCEDDRFELDLKINLIEGTHKSGEELLTYMEMNGENAGLCLEEHFSILKLRCIKELFKDKGSKFLDSLRENAQNVLPIVLERLELEKNKLAQIREESKNGWSKILKDNHIKALGFT